MRASTWRFSRDLACAKLFVENLRVDWSFTRFTTFYDFICHQISFVNRKTIKEWHEFIELFAKLKLSTFFMAIFLQKTFNWPDLSLSLCICFSLSLACSGLLWVDSDPTWLRLGRVCLCSLSESVSVSLWHSSVRQVDKADRRWSRVAWCPCSWRYLRSGYRLHPLNMLGFK